MLEPRQALDKARNLYRDRWRTALVDADPGPYTVPLGAPSAATITDRAGDVAAWLTRWRLWTAHHHDVTLRTRVTRTRFGDQPVHTHLDIPDIAALAGLDPETAKHWQRAGDRWTRLSPHRPGETVRPWLAQIVDLDEYDFTTLLAATAWFRAHPRSGLTVRRVPVPGMHTKWLARRRALVLACLGTAATTVDPAGAVDAAGPDEDADPLDIPADELDALGLRALPAEVSIVLADADLRAAVGGLRQVTAPIDELAALRLHPDAVLVTENKEPAVAWPDTSGLVIIHSLGNHLDALGRLPWIPHDRCWYWGDLDRHGLTLLSRARSAAPRLASLLMSTAEVAIYRSRHIVENLDRYDPPDPTLTPAEAQTLAALPVAGGYLRIEQERLPLLAATAALSHARADLTPGRP
jgi:hypothetical protein